MRASVSIWRNGLGYCDLIYSKGQRHDHWNPTKKHCLKSRNDIA